MTIFKYVLVALLVGAAAGFIPMYLQLSDAQTKAAETEERLTTELAASRDRLTLSSIHSQLGVLFLQVRESDFEAARTTSTRLFNSIDEALETVEDADDQRRLRTVVETRDQVTAALALNDPLIADTLERLFALLSASLA